MQNKNNHTCSDYIYKKKNQCARGIPNYKTFLNTRRPPQVLTRVSVKILKRVADSIILRLIEKKMLFPRYIFLISCDQNLYLKIKIAPIQMVIDHRLWYGIGNFAKIFEKKLKSDTFSLFDNIFLEENKLLVIKHDESHWTQYFTGQVKQKNIFCYLKTCCCKNVLKMLRPCFFKYKTIVVSKERRNEREIYFARICRVVIDYDFS